MVSNDFDTLDHAVSDLIESDQPALQVDPGVLKGLESLLGHASLTRLVEDARTAQPRHAAVVMADDQHLAGVELVNGDDNAAHHAAKGVRDNRAGGFDDLDVTIAKIHGPRQQLNQARVHAGQDDHFLVRKTVGAVLLVVLALHEATVEIENFLNQRHSSCQNL